MNILIWDRILNPAVLFTLILVLMAFLPLSYSVYKTWSAQDKLDE